MSNDPLLQPYHLKHLTLRNRLMSTAHEPSYAEDGLPKTRYRLYHREKARGGLALTMTAGSALVSRDSPPAFGNLEAYRDEIVPWLAELTDDCHAEGCAVMIQLTHLGRRTGWSHGDWLPVLSASPVREAAHRAFPKAMEAWDIDRVVGDYAAAAERMQAAGLDGIEIEAYGHLLDSFWSPLTNRRDDDYAGTLDNRLRFTWRVIDAIRAAVGDDFIVGIRMVADEACEKGLGREEGLRIADAIAASGRFDFINLIRGHIDTDAALTRVIPVHGMASAPHLDFAGEVRERTRFPVFHAAKIADVATARHAVAEGRLDMVGMTRAHIADPHIVRRIMAGEEQRIRPCVGATYCLDRIYENGEALCIHNASTGREASLPHAIEPSPKPCRVVVIGAGPAGLEAARVAAERGHQVVVLEAAGVAGGQMQLLVRNARRRELIGIVDWRLAELDRLAVDVRYHSYAEADTVLALEPDVVVVATGGLPQSPPMAQGETLAVSSWDVLAGDVPIADNVLVYDDNGAHPGMSAAECIATHGSRLELVTPERFFAPELGGMNHAPYQAILTRHDVRITIAHRLMEVHRDGNQLRVVLRSDYDESVRRERFVDQLVVEHGTEANDELYLALQPLSRNGGRVDYDVLVGQHRESERETLFPGHNSAGAFDLYRIGDAVTSRNIHAAIYDAMRYGVRY